MKREHSESIEERVRKRVEEKKGFLTHLGVYLACGLFFFLVNLITSPSYWWFIWPMLAWGLGLLIHYLSVFGIPGQQELIDRWEMDEMEKELIRMYRAERKSLPSADPDTFLESLDLEDPDVEKQGRTRYRDEDLV